MDIRTLSIDSQKDKISIRLALSDTILLRK